MDINPIADMATRLVSTSCCGEMVQNEVQVNLLRESIDFHKDIAAKLLQSLGIGQHIDTVV